MTRSALALIAFGLALLVPGVAHAAQPVPISYHAWTTTSDFNSGSYAGTSLATSGRLTLGPTGTTGVTYADGHYGNIPAVAGTWTSPTFETAPFTELVASWNADTPSGSAVDSDAVRRDGADPRCSALLAGDPRRAVPEYDGGGEAWCSPTSTSMVLDYWHALPPSSEWTSWVNPLHDDPWVDNTARQVFDYHYDGELAVQHRVCGRPRPRRVRDAGLNEAEQFINAGIPLVASIAANPNKLTGFLFKDTNGHLLVIAGFTENGDVVVDDPASTSDGTVQRVYDRGEFERAWLPATGGIVYVMKPAGMSLPTSFGGNW